MARFGKSSGSGSVKATFVPKLSIEITPEQRKKLNNLNLPYGSLRVIFGKFLDIYLEMQESQNGRLIMASVLYGQLTWIEAMELYHGDSVEAVVPGTPTGPSSEPNPVNP